MIQFQITGTLAFLHRLEQRRDVLIEALVRKTNVLLYQLQAKIQNNYLSGQVLASRSGKLRGSIRVVEATDEGNRIFGAVFGAGGPAFYGVYFEKGGTHSYVIEPVTKQALSFIMNGHRVFFARVLHPPIPHLPFMSPAAEEMEPLFVEELQATVTEVYHDRT